ncbi:MAG: hypothetical protein KKH75_04140 [Actinobacteria bacterium]|nr:hypothetical protein [Actinomycetota bacterium]
MSVGGESSGGPVRPAVAVVFSLTGFVALVICGLGVTSLLTNADVIAVPGLGQLAGVLGSVLAAAAFAGVLWSAVRRPHPSFWAAISVAIAASLAYVARVVIGALVDGADAAAALGIVGRTVTSWFGAVVVLSGLVAAWGGIALVRTRAERPRWPWERGEEE